MRSLSFGSLLVLLALVLFGPSALAAHEAGLPRHPAPSPDGSQIAFSWQGDLWIVSSEGGEARRITANPATERFPIWSRDGRLIAFSSDRHGNADVFVMPADGSAAPTRLSEASWSDEPLDFTPDGDALIFASRRNESVRRMPALYVVPIEGGTPRLLDEALAHAAAYSPEGSRMATVRGGTYWWRQGYRGAADRDIWLVEGDEYTLLTEFEGDDDRPGWIDEDTLVFMSTREGRKNLYRYELGSGESEALTQHELGVRFPRVSADGSLIAYEEGEHIWTLASAAGTPKRLEILVPADPVDAQRTHNVERRGASALDVSPDGKTAAIVVDADVFLVEVLSKDEQELAEPRTVQLTSTPGRDDSPRFAPDGDAIVFVSDRAGNDDLYIARRSEKESAWTEGFTFDVEPLVATEAPERNPHFSPDGEHIAFVRGRGDIVVRNLKTGDERVLLEHWLAPDFAWSPDGRYIAYSRYDDAFNADVFVVPAAGGEAYNVSRHPDDDVAPAWSPDGRRLVWASKRHQDTMDVWGVWLRQEDDERTSDEWLRFWREEEENKKKAKKDKSGEKGDDDKDDKRRKKDDEDEEGDEKKEPELPEVVIEFDRLWERAEPITRMEGDEAQPFVSKDGRRIFFTAEPTGQRDLYSVRFDGEDEKRLTEGGKSPGSPMLSDDGKEIWFLAQGGTIGRVSSEGKPGDPVPFEAAFERDEEARRAAVYDEAFRTIREWFYDPEFHGVDVDAMFARYRPLAMAASTKEDFGDVVNMLLGEFNASHMGYRTGRGGEGDQTGEIGALYDPAAGGPGLLVREVLRDAPAARVDVGLEAGDRLLSVGGREVDPSDNVYGLFANTVGRRVPITFEKAGGAKKSAVVEPIPLGATRQLRYDTWVEERRRLVEELSGGRLGYIHIQSMGMPSFEAFEQALFSAAKGKEGLIIDVRSNGGGWTTDMLMAVLNVSRHAYTISRDADPDVRAYPQSRLPLAAWTRPALVMCDEESYSNAEIFSWAFDTLGRGMTVGNETFGAVISTGGTRLLDGALLRLPFRGWYVAGSNINMENNGYVPDILVTRPPAEDTLAKPDTQLARAVEAFLAELESDPRYGSW